MDKSDHTEKEKQENAERLDSLQWVLKNESLEQVAELLDLLQS